MYAFKATMDTEKIITVLQAITKDNGGILYNGEYMACQGCEAFGSWASMVHDASCIVTLSREILDNITK